MSFLFINIEESFFILFIAFLIFGPKKIPEIARSFGRSIKYFKNIIQEIKYEIWKISELNKNLKNEIGKEIKKSTKKINKDLTNSIKRDD